MVTMAEVPGVILGSMLSSATLTPVRDTLRIFPVADTNGVHSATPPRQRKFDDNPLALAFTASLGLFHRYPSTELPRSVAVSRKRVRLQALSETATQPTVRRATASSITVEANFRSPSSSSGATGCGTATAG